jgi:hypothetical protein
MATEVIGDKMRDDTRVHVYAISDSVTIFVVPCFMTNPSASGRGSGTQALIIVDRNSMRSYSCYLR